MEAVTMEAYSTSSSSSCSSALPGARGLKVQSFHASLHSVRKPLTTKPWKKPIAPLPPPTPPKVYTVDPANFRDLVQKLTGAPDMSQSQHQTLSLWSSASAAQLHDHQLPHQRLQRLAPPPLHVAAPPLMCGAEVSAQLHLLPGLDQTKTQNQKFSDNAIITSSDSLGLNLLSPSFYNWCTFPLLSPGTLSSMGQSTVP